MIFLHNKIYFKINSIMARLWKPLAPPPPYLNLSCGFLSYSTQVKAVKEENLARELVY